MPSFSIASCSNGAEIHEKTNWFSKEVRPLNRTKMKINISFKNQDVVVVKYEKQHPNTRRFPSEQGNHAKT